MKTLILSYISSITLIVLVSLPAVKAAPLDMIPRIGVYLGVPSAVLLSILVLAVQHIIQKGKDETNPETILMASKKQLRPFNERKIA